ncbi:hypothetical protein A1O7_05043 [Cladophialophora yegresii CBS 114405]|uniref:Uncharacterized protein n=1 Tax=Cladophialophora yegresii CBS 114405 TaxID=1182544 RepID=W9W7C8_9EURO|nr:uncharacterized protein A1O7_05043 [Cladophialophora yegresii CBS 114405]EXJ60890.1 hypothetical protein A1O7_05043 [Cladophialophora yegresii CBS 114405]
MSNTSTTTRKSAADIINSASRPTKPFARHETHKHDPRKQLWCDTQWTTLSMQAKKTHNLPTLPYFDPDTMLLSKEVNEKLWRQLERLWDYLGPERAPFATPVMAEGGEVKWHSFMNGDKGDEAEVYASAVDAFMSRTRKPGEYDG